VDETPSNVVESIVKDGVADQRRAGVMPRPNDLRKYVQGVVETMERRDAENRLRIKPKETPAPKPAVARSTEQMESEYQKRLKRKGHEPLPGSWTVTRTPVKQSRSQLATLKNLRARREDDLKRRRIRLLMSKPDWAARLATINPIVASSGTPEQKRECEAAYLKIFEDAERVFGPWWKDAPRKLHFT
jgi:hypothetical protein